jgi:hypothetical protein
MVQDSANVGFGTLALPSIVGRRSAPARQIDRVLALRQSQRFFEGLLKIGFHMAGHAKTRTWGAQFYSAMAIIWRARQDETGTVI